jgi:hypothetical protein
MLFHHLLGEGWVSPEIGRFYVFFELRQLKFPGREVKDAPVIDGIDAAQTANGLSGLAFKLLPLIANKKSGM